jgi:hypothetical protein
MAFNKPLPTMTETLLSPAPRARSWQRLSSVTVLFAAAAALSACGGGGSDETPAPAPVGTPSPPSVSPPPPPSSGAVMVTGKATFESVPASSTGSLNYAGVVAKPVRGATVELLNAAGAVIGTGFTNATGDFNVGTPSAVPMRVRVRAELKSSNYDFKVLDNTAGGALYAMDSASFTPTAASTAVNLVAPAGWGGSGYTGDRVAGPFSILDVAYQAKEKVFAASANTTLEPLRIFWSKNNRPVSGAEDRPNGLISTTYSTQDQQGPVLYILGADGTDTDEYDLPVLAHEMGHYLQYAVSRDDTLGGEHRRDDRLDMRVAFSEGWGYGWAGIALDNPILHDSFGPTQSQGGRDDLRVAPTGATVGWFQEATVQHLFWKYYQNPDIGFAGIYTVMTQLRTSPAFTSIHNFNALLKQARPAAAPFITSSSAALNVNGTDIYGSGETVTGGLATALPIYKSYGALGSTTQICLASQRATGTAADRGNRLGDYGYLRFTLSGARTITITRASNTTDATDPDLSVLKSDGGYVPWPLPNNGGQSALLQNATLNSESGSTTLPAGTHTLLFTDYLLAQPTAAQPVTQTTRCFDVRID